MKQMSYKEDIYYIVTLKDSIIDSGFYKTTACHRFCGRLVNQNYGNFYFELNGSDALVIIPHSWIEWMAPSKVHWDLMRKKDE
jgi:hypothetical protein